MNIEKEIEHIYFKMQLLFGNSDLDRFLFEYDIKKHELELLYIMMKKYRQKIDNGEEVSSILYEQEVYNIIPNLDGDYHFAESFAELNWEQRTYEEVFEALYGNSGKFKHKIDEKRNENNF